MTDDRGDVYYPQCRAILSLIFDGFGPTALDSDEFVIPVLPTAATVHRNSYKEADTWSVTFDANDLPLDPDLIRAGAIEIYLYQVADAGPDARVISRQQPTTEDPAGTNPRSLVQELGLGAFLRGDVDRWTQGNPPAIVGLFDEPDLELAEDGKTFTIAGKDYTAHLASMQWPPLPGGRPRRIPVGRRLDDIMSEILAEADPRGRLALDVRDVEDADLPIVGAAEVRGHGRGIPVEQQTTYWDVLYKLAIRHGLICYVEGLSVVLSKPRNIGPGDEARVRRLTWGHNVAHLRLSRRMGKVTAPSIIVQGYDPRTGAFIEEEFPRGKREIHAKNVKADVKKTHERTKIKAPPKHPRRLQHGSRTQTVRKTDEYEFVPAHGITDRAILRQMAETRYRLLARGERRVVLRTQDLRDTNDAELLDLKAGDAVQVEFDDFNRELLASTEPFEAKVAHLLDRGYGEAIAGVIAEHYDKLEGLRRPLRVKEVTYEWTTEGAGGEIAIEVELQDYAVIDGERGPGETRAARRDDRLRRADGSRLGIGSTARQERAVLRPRGGAR